MKLSIPLIALAAGLALAPAQAATVYRCEDANGTLSFSAYGCTPGSQASLQRADNPRPGGKRPVPMARPKRAGKTASQAEPTVVAVREDGCGNLLSPRERRQAIIRGQVRIGMSRADVENALGPPRRISQLDNLTRYRYETQGRQRAREVTFDERGCVRRRR